MTVGLRVLDEFLLAAGIRLIPVDVRQGVLARLAFNRFGKGRHKARLNYGDCFSYAATIALDTTLLCKGNDFIHMSPSSRFS